MNNVEQEMLNRFDEVVNSLKDISSEYGPMAAEAIISALYIDAVFSIVTAFALIPVLLGFMYLGYKLCKYALDNYSNSGVDEACDSMFIVGMVMGIVSLAVLLIVIFGSLLNSEYWTIIISPEAGVSRYIMGL